MRGLETGLERTIFASRWLLAPFFVGLIVAILVLLAKFAKELVHLVQGVWTSGVYESVISILTLVDIALIASLLLIMIFSGYENFVSKIGIGVHEDRPSWMGKVSFSDLKLKLIGAIVAISAVELLKAFLTSTSFTTEQLTWKVIIHLTFVITGVLFAFTDRLTEGKYGDKAKPVAWSEQAAAEKGEG
jgi:uncharacterized protein (TIGR00645 family)